MQKVPFIVVAASVSLVASPANAQKQTDHHGKELQAHSHGMLLTSADLSLDPNWRAHQLGGHGVTSVQIGDADGLMQLIAGSTNGTLWAIPAAGLEEHLSLPGAPRDIPQDATFTVVYEGREFMIVRFEHLSGAIWSILPVQS